MEKLAEYSIVVFDGFDDVKQILGEHEIELEKKDFCGDIGFTFQVKEDVIGASPVIRKLNRLFNEGKIILSRKYENMNIPKSNEYT